MMARMSRTQTSAPPPPLDRNFHVFWGGQTLAQFGTQLGAVAVPVVSVQVLHATESQVGYLNAASTAAFLLVGLPAGAWVDRWFKRRTMIIADLVRIAVAAMVPVLWLTGHLAIWHLYVLAGVLGVATVFFDVSYQSFIPMLVRDDQVARANSRLETSSQVARMAGPGLGGLLLHVISAPMLMLADAIGFSASALMLWRTRDHEAEHRIENPPADDHVPHLGREIAEGLRFVARQPAIRAITACTALSNMTSAITFTLMPIVVLRLLGLSPATYGLIMTAGSIGGLIAAAVTGRLVDHFGEKAIITLGASLLAGCLFVPPLVLALWAHRPVLATGVLMVVELIQTVGVLLYNITQVSMRQRLCPKPLLGRMNASIRFVVWGVMPLAALAAGWLGGALGVQRTLWLAAAAGLTMLLPLAAIRRAMA